MSPQLPSFSLLPTGTRTPQTTAAHICAQNGVQQLSHLIKRTGEKKKYHLAMTSSRQGQLDDEAIVRAGRYLGLTVYSPSARIRMHRANAN